MPRRQRVAQARALSSILGRPESVTLRQELEDTDVRFRAYKADVVSDLSDLDDRITTLEDAPAATVDPDDVTDGLVRARTFTISDVTMVAGLSTTLLAADATKMYHLLDWVGRIDITTPSTPTVSFTIRYDGSSTTSLGSGTLLTGTLGGKRLMTFNATTYSVQTGAEDMLGAAIILTLSAGATGLVTNGGFKLRIAYSVLTIT